MTVAVLLQIFGGYDDNVNRLSNTYQVAVDAMRQFASMNPGLHYQQIDVAVRPHVAAGGRSEQDDALRIGHLHDPINNGVENVVVHNTTRSF